VTDGGRGNECEAVRPGGAVLTPDSLCCARACCSGQEHHSVRRCWCRSAHQDGEPDPESVYTCIVWLAGKHWRWSSQVRRRRMSLGGGSHLHLPCVCCLCTSPTVASSMIGTVEGCLYAQKAGLDPLTVIKAVQVSAGARSPHCARAWGMEGRVFLCCCACNLELTQLLNDSTRACVAFLARTALFCLPP